MTPPPPTPDTPDASGTSEAPDAPNAATRRRLLRAAGALPLAAALGPAWALTPATPMTSTPPFDWRPADHGAPGIAPDFIERLDAGVASGEMSNLHAVFVARGGRVVAQRYYAGEDELWGRPLGRVAFDATTLHDLRSVSKSVVGLLYGIALRDGLVPAPETPVMDAFARYADLAADPRRRRIRVADLLSMTTGLDWNEDLPYADPRNSERAMERAADRCRYVLERPIVAEPGTRWRYNGGCTALLGHLIADGAGMPLLRFAREKLFTPMGIDHSEWTPGSNGEAAAASGLRLRAPDLARVGQLVLQDGQWNGQPLVPADWLAGSLTPRAEAFDGLQYGRHWYLARRRDGSPACMGIGWGGQRLVVVPSQALVYVVFMGNYERAEQLKALFAVQNLIHASVR